MQQAVAVSGGSSARSQLPSPKSTGRTPLADDRVGRLDAGPSWHREKSGLGSVECAGSGAGSPKARAGYQPSPSSASGPPRPQSSAAAGLDTVTFGSISAALPGVGDAAWGSGLGQAAAQLAPDFPQPAKPASPAAASAAAPPLPPTATETAQAFPASVNFQPCPSASGSVMPAPEKASSLGIFEALDAGRAAPASSQAALFGDIFQPLDVGKGPWGLEQAPPAFPPIAPPARPFAGGGLQIFEPLDPGPRGGHAPSQPPPAARAAIIAEELEEEACELDRRLSLLEDLAAGLVAVEPPGAGGAPLPPWAGEARDFGAAFAPDDLQGYYVDRCRVPLREAYLADKKRRHEGDSHPFFNWLAGKSDQAKDQVLEEQSWRGLGQFA